MRRKVKATVPCKMSAQDMFYAMSKRTMKPVMMNVLPVIEA